MALERALRELLNVRPKSPYYSHLDQFVTTSGENDTVQRSVVLECSYDKPNLSQEGKRPIFGSSGQFRSGAAALDGKSGPVLLAQGKVTAL